MAALTKTIIKASETEAVIKIAGSDTAAVIINLTTDLLPYANIIDGVGTVTIGTGATSIVGVGTSFNTDVHVNAKVYTTAGVYVGIIASVTDATHATLAANGAVAIAGTTYKIAYATQVIIGSPSVSITAVQWAGEPGAIYKVDRNSVRIITPLADNGNLIDMMGTYFPPDNVNATYPISVTIVDKLAAAVQGEIWIKVRKNSVYDSRAVLTLYKAMQYDKLVASKPAITKKVNEAPKAIKSGVSKPRDSNAEETRKLKARAKASGSIRDAASVFERFI